MKRNKKRNAPPPPTLAPAPPSTPSIDKRSLFGMLLVNAVLLAGVYLLLIWLGVSMAPLLYLGAGAILAIGYIVYNKGFVYRGVTANQLSDDLSDAQKEALLAEVRERDARSKWVLTILLPMVVILLLDALYVYVLPGLEGWFQ